MYDHAIPNQKYKNYTHRTVESSIKTMQYKAQVNVGDCQGPER